MFAVIRVRGKINVNPNIKKTLELLCLTRTNHLVLVQEKQLEMLRKVEAYVTWGEIGNETLEKLLKKRALVLGNKKIDSAFLKEKKIHSIKELAESINEQKISLRQIGIKKVFRLRAPRKGYGRRGIKKPYSMGGALGYRGTDINDLILRMA